jgi:hypothetical protein
MGKQIDYISSVKRQAFMSPKNEYFFSCIPLLSKYIGENFRGENEEKKNISDNQQNVLTR